MFHLSAARLDLLTEHMGLERGFLCLSEQALLLFGENGATIQSRRATLAQKDKLLAFIFFKLPAHNQRLISLDSIWQHGGPKR